MPVLLTLLIILVLLSSGCSPQPAGKEQCLLCHRGIEHTSSSHSGCVSCHGGNPNARVKEEAHRGVFGISNRSFPARWEMGCGQCHQHQLERMYSSQMYTATGMISQIQETWEGKTDGKHFASRPQERFDAAGNRLTLNSISEHDHLSGELYRKFCARCHVAYAEGAENGGGHPAGCAACHFPFDHDATYRGADQTIRNRQPYAKTHTMQSLPSLKACSQCHTRSGRTALSFQGILDGNSGMVPTRQGLPGPLTGSDKRTYTRTEPDVHFKAGMDCIDCHTSREIMGDGYTYANQHAQREVMCEDCHGSLNEPPRFRAINRNHEDVLRESRSYRFPVVVGMEMILTSKGRPFSNVLHVDGNVVVQHKQTGVMSRAKVITGTPEHTIAGHGRLSCTSCHSKTVVQCYGCHTQYDRRGYHHDTIKSVVTKGQFTETEDYRTLYPFPLAVSGSGKITPVTPGCQTFVTVINEAGSRVSNEAVSTYKGKRQMRFAPFFGHTVTRSSVGCTECHADPTFLGFGQHVIDGTTIVGTLRCNLMAGKPLDGFMTMHKGRVAAYATVTHTKGRPLNQQEVIRTLKVNLCIVCHQSARDPIYRTRIHYRALDDRLHTRLLN